MTWLFFQGGGAVYGNFRQETEDRLFQWLDPDKKVYVLQNRKYQKTKEFFFSLLGGLGLSQPYTSSVQLEPRVSFYLSEEFGFEVFYAWIDHRRNSTYESLEATSPNVLPVIRTLSRTYGAGVHWVPWYAKIHVFGSIFYFDWYFGTGVGRLEAAVDTRVRVTDAIQEKPQGLFHGYFQTGHLFYFSAHWLFRWDLTGLFFRAPLAGFTGASSWFSDFHWSVGIGWSPG